MKILVKLCLLSNSARQSRGDETFQACQLGVAWEMNTNLGAYEILRRLTKIENFSVHEQRFMNFMLMTVVLSGFAKLTINEFSWCIFYLLILLASL
jgi:hypothetical protein